MSKRSHLATSPVDYKYEEGLSSTAPFVKKRGAHEPPLTCARPQTSMPSSPTPTTPNASEFSAIPSGLTTPGNDPNQSLTFGESDSPAKYKIEEEEKKKKKKKKKKVDPNLGEFYYDKMSKEKTEGNSKSPDQK